MSGTGKRWGHAWDREKVESIDSVICLSFLISYSFYHVKNKEVMV